MTEQEFIKKIEDKFPNEKYTIIYQGEKSNDFSIIKCLNCGKKIQHKNCYWFSNRKKHICKDCNYKRLDTLKNEEKIKERLKEKASNITFFMQERKGIRHNVVSYNCNKCGRRNQKEVANLLRQKYDCIYCEGRKEGKDTDIFIGQMVDKFGASFSLLSEYINTSTAVTVKCNKCGFIRKIKPNAFLSSGYCPKCGDKDSKGEKAIRKFLDRHDISYETQKYFKDWNIGIHYFDFYLPDLKIVLEYHGRQHYKFIDYFHKTEQNFLYRLEKDKVKRNRALQEGLNYISISYKVFDYLSVILEKLFNSTTIPIGSRGKCLEIETIQNLDEDIVCSFSKEKVKE